MTLEECYNAALPYSMAGVNAENSQDLLAALGNYRRAVSVIESNPDWQKATQKRYEDGIDAQIFGALQLLASHCRERIDAVVVVLTRERNTQQETTVPGHVSAPSARAPSPAQSVHSQHRRQKTPSPEFRARPGMRNTMRDAKPSEGRRRRYSDHSRKPTETAQNASRAALMAWSPANQPGPSSGPSTSSKSPYPNGSTNPKASRSQPSLPPNGTNPGSQNGSAELNSPLISLSPPASQPPTPPPEPRRKEKYTQSRSGVSDKTSQGHDSSRSSRGVEKSRQSPTGKSYATMGPSTSPRKAQGSLEPRPTTPDVNPALEKHTASSSAKIKKQGPIVPPKTQRRGKSPSRPNLRQTSPQRTNHTSEPADIDDTDDEDKSRRQRELSALKRCKNVDEGLGQTILNEIVVHGDEVHWSDIAGLEAAKSALKEAVVYPFLRPDLFRGLREPARGMLLFGPPGTGKTMLARAVATESNSTFFSISSSSLTSKYLGESEKLVRALFTLAKELQPSIIFVDEIDSLLSARSDGGSEHETSRRLKTEFLIQWSSLAKAAAARDDTEAPRVLVLAATNLPWQIDDAARRRFVRRQYIPLPERETRTEQIMSLIKSQTHALTPDEIKTLIDLTEGYSGSDITALTKDAAMGPLRSLGEALLTTKMELIRPIGFEDFESSLKSVRPSVSKEGLQRYEEWNDEYGSQG